VLRVDFYLLAANTLDARLSAACRLANKALASGQRVYIQAENADEAMACDDWLWSYKPESFVPHHCLGDGAFIAAPVLIGLQTPSASDGVCLNLSVRQPQGLAQFQRVLEVVGSDEASKKAARLRWQYYKQQGFSLEKHDL
jgi:DNA polymerase-3 subunit chi